MMILALESSAKAASVALCDGGRIIAQSRQASGLTHSRTLLAMTEDLLKNTETAVSQIDAFAVAGGPGSFTGIRIGMAAAKGLAWGTGKPPCSVSTAFHFFDFRLIVCPVMDARRSQVYNALFSVGTDGPVRLTEDRAVSLEELAGDAGKSDSPFWFVGDGAALCAARFSELGLPFVLAPEPLLLPSAWGVAAAAMKGPFLDPADAEPNYLRLSQAERERLSRLIAGDHQKR